MASIPSSGSIRANVPSGGAIYPAIGDKWGSGVPAAFTAGQWSVADAESGGTLTVTISSLPALHGGTVSQIDYRVDGGTWTDSGVTTATNFNITGLTDDVEYDIELRITTDLGTSGTSDTKAQTPTTASSALTRTYGGTATSGADASSYNLTASSGLSATGYNLACIHMREVSGATVTAVSIDGVAATLIYNYADAGAGHIVWALAASGGNTSGTIAVTCSNTALRCTAQWWAISGTPNFTATDTANDPSPTDNGSTITASLDINVVTGGLVFAAMQYNTVDLFNSAIGVTSDVADTTNESMYTMAGSAEISGDETPRTVSLTIDDSGTASIFTAAAVSIAPA